MLASQQRRSCGALCGRCVQACSMLIVCERTVGALLKGCVKIEPACSLRLCASVPACSIAVHACNCNFAQQFSLSSKGLDSHDCCLLACASACVVLPPRDEAVFVGRALLAKMKELLDRQQFEVVLQVGGCWGLGGCGVALADVVVLQVGAAGLCFGCCEFGEERAGVLAAGRQPAV